MRKIYFENKQFLDDIHNISDNSTTVFPYKNNEVIKLINTVFHSDTTETKISDLSKYINESYLFPKALVYVNNQFVGYTKEYINALNCYEESDKIMITKEEFEDAKSKFLKDTIKLSEDLLLCYDLKYNVFYDIDNKRLVCIDTDDFKIAKDKKEAFLYNIPYVKNEFKIIEESIVFKKPKVRVKAS